jgi:hypothetical protein
VKLIWDLEFGILNFLSGISDLGFFEMDLESQECMGFLMQEY